MRQAFSSLAVLALLCGGAAAQPAAKPETTRPEATKPEVGPAAPAPGVFALKKTGAALHLSVTGHSFTAKAALENYLAFRAAEATLDNRMQWFSFTEHRAKSDTVPVPKGDPAGPRFSFRMEYFRPQWRYRLAGAKAWTSWSPLSGKPFPDLKGATDYQLSADIVPHKGMLDDISPLAFDAGATSDYLINQVQAPK
jgi:hypothetical protein